MNTREPRILLQGVPEWGQPPWIAFHAPRAIHVAHRLDEVRAVLHAVEQAAEAGRWAAGFVAYEAAPAFDPALETHEPGPTPLAWFAEYDAWTPSAPPSGHPAPLSLEPALDEAVYAERIGRIKECIARGETYQVNFTFPLRGDDPTPPEARFAALIRSQRCRYGALIETDAFSICSASPELFFLQTGDEIVCRPMKGTAPRGRWTEEDEAIADCLQASPKDRAENVMIVDMMRNDLGRIARTGTVRTSRLFELERLPTVWQLTSTIEAETDAGLAAVFAALFPCASVTGAPKVRTMHWIRRLEDGPRGVYTGAVGVAGPGRRAQFNVAIRTLFCGAAQRSATYGVGSGIVWDSDASREYAECQAKALVLAGDTAFDVITSLRWEPGAGCPLWPRHVARLRRAAEHFGYPFDEAQVEAAWRRAIATFPREPRRVRIAISADGAVHIEHQSPPGVNPTRVALAAHAMDTRSPFLFHKTTQRAMYEAARAAAPDAEDVLLWNEVGELTESTIANVAVRVDGQWTTPPVRCGLLGGVMRDHLLATGAWVEGVVRREQLAPGTEVQLANAVRGVWTATLISGG